MSSIISELESYGAVLPDFGRSNLEVARQLGNWKGEFVGNKKKKVFIILDGFGYNILSDVMKKYGIKSELLDNSQIKKITSVFPSSTVNALTCIHSGLTTAEHGVPGTVLLIPEIGQLMRVFGWSSAMPMSPRSKLYNLDPYLVFPEPGLFNRINSEHQTVFLYREALMNGEVTTAMVRNAKKVPYISLEDMLIHVARLVKEDKHEMVSVYYDITDHMEHLYSPHSEEFTHLIRSIMQSLDRILLPALKGSDYDLIITADHGHITLKKSSVIELDHRSKMMEYLNLPPWNEARIRFLSVVPGKEKAFEDFFDRNYGKHAMVFETDELIRSGIFGKREVAPNKRARFGSHVIIPKADKYFEYMYPGTTRKYGPKFGHHGGLSPDEMEIPAILY